MGQTMYGADTFVATVAVIVTPIALVLILDAHRTSGRRGLMAGWDWLLILGFIALIGLSGGRGKAITIIICLLYAYSRKRFKLRTVALTLLTVLAFTVAVSMYRQAMRGGSTGQFTLKSILTDLSVVTYTTGLTAREVPAHMGYLWGGTYWVGILRQLPSPIANRLFGPPYDTANYAFRDMIGFEDPNLGLAYSVPAEGYLNFGIIGTFLACLVFGLLVAWAYSQAAWPAGVATALLYPVMMGVLPIMLRSDALGTIKTALYPFLVAVVIFAYAKTIAAREAAPKRRRRTCPRIPGSSADANSSVADPVHLVSFSSATCVDQDRARRSPTTPPAGCQSNKPQPGGIAARACHRD